MALTKKTVQPKEITSKIVLRKHPTSPTGISVWTLLAKISLAVGAFCLPVVSGNWTPDRWEIHKMMVLLLVMTIAWFGYFLGQFRRPTIIWTWHPLDWLVIVIGLTAVIGTLTSIDWWTSLTGLQGSYSETLPAILGYMSIYFLSARLFKTAADRMIVWSALIGGIGLALLIQVFQLSGISLLGEAAVNDQLFSPLANSPLQASLLAALVGTIGLLLWAKANEFWSKICLAALVTLSWVVLLFMSQAIGWAAFALGMIIVVFGQAQRTAASSRLVIVAVLLAAAGMLGQLLHITKYADVPPTTEIGLSQSLSAATAFSTLADQPVVGSGPSTWYSAFVKYRPLSFNTDPQWGSRFLRSGAEWSQLLATTGLAGFTAWIGLLLISGWEFWRLQRHGYSFTGLTSFFVVLLLALSAAVTNWGFTLLVLGWYALGLGRAKIAESDLQVSKTSTATPFIGFAVVVILAIVVWYPGLSLYASQMATAKAQNQAAKKASSSSIIRTLESAVRLDKHNLDAGIFLANVYAVKIQEDLQANDVPLAKKDLASATETMRTAVLNNANNPVAYEAENNLLNGLANYLPKPEELANANFMALQKLEPANPIHDVGYGQTLQVIRARAASDTSTVTNQDKLEAYLQTAIKAYNEALRKKPDYLQARYARADAYQSGGNYQAALDDLESLTTVSPTIAIFWAGKGAVLAKLEKIDLATAAFEQALAVGPTEVNSYLLYSQALVEAKKTTEAKAVLDRGIKAMPENTDLTEALKKVTS